MKLPNTRWQKVVQVSLWNSINFVACSVSFTILMCTFSSVIAQREWETIPQVNCLKCHPSGSLLHWMYVGHYSKTSCGVNSINKIFPLQFVLIPINIFLYTHYDNFDFKHQDLQFVDIYFSLNYLRYWLCHYISCLKILRRLLYKEYNWYIPDLSRATFCSENKGDKILNWTYIIYC